MATIREVAILAKVSVATVSNVLNGKTKNAELIERVETAMHVLSYRPDANARNMRNARSQLIGVIIPNLTNLDYTMFVRTLDDELRQKNWNMLMRLSHNNRLLERNGIEQCLAQRVDGIIFYSTTVKPSTTLAVGSVPSVLVTKYRLPDYPYDHVEVDYREAFEHALCCMRKRGVRRLGLLIEPELLFDEYYLNVYRRYYPGSAMVKSVSYRKERGFKSMFELVSEFPDIDGFIFGNLLIAQGAEKALEVLSFPDVPLLAIKEDNWIDDDAHFDGILSISHKYVAQLSARKLFDAIENPMTHQCITERVRAVYSEQIPIVADVRPFKSEIRLALLNSPAAESLEMLSKIYSNHSGVSIAFEKMEHEELEDAIFGEAVSKSGRYDAFMMDDLWLDALAESELLMSLDDFAVQHPTFFDGFIDGTLNGYSLHGGNVYAFPFISGAQLLFYQRDLFEDQGLKRRFERLYGQELAPPTTWPQFNLIAEFFTQKMNPKSPVKYGVTSVFGENSRMTIGFLNRLWAYGGDIIDESWRVVINDSNALAALKNYIASYRYSPTDPSRTSHLAVAEAFMAGESAMTIIYDSYAVGFNDYSKSRVAGNIGQALLPAGISILAGWSLAVNVHGRSPEGTRDFLAWVCSEKNAVPLSLLGGLTVRQSYFDSNIHHIIYPWKDLVTEAFKGSRRRRVANRMDGVLQNELFSHTLSHEIVRILQGEISEEEAIVNMENGINRLLRVSQNALQQTYQ